MTRRDGRADDELRPVTFERDYTEMADGSCLVTFGRTKVLCTASVDDNVPAVDARLGQGLGHGGVLDAARIVAERVDREAAKGKQSGRTVEIQRLIGRSLRAACDLTMLGERQVVVDCDVLQADGGTRTASICGGFLALHDALATAAWPPARSTAQPLHSFCAAVSVGIVGGVPVLDLAYAEDSAADVDMNVVTIRPLAGGEHAVRRGPGHRRGRAVQPLRAGARCSQLAEPGLAEIVELQAEMIAEPPRPRRR